MTTKELPPSPPLSIEVDEVADTITLVMTLAPMDCQSESGKMDVLCTTNGWVRTEFVCPRTAEKIQVNVFVGTRNGKKS
jgi:hypothetical protein